MRITNTAQVSLPVAVWLVHDEYDYSKENNYISATGLLKPTRQIVLASRVDPETQVIDVMDMLKTSLGHAIHDSIEKAWTRGAERSLRLLGYPQSVRDRIRINPTDDVLAKHPDCIPVYMEQRVKKTINVNGTDYVVGGKYDIVTEGLLQDYKSTSAFVWVKGSRDDEHRLQGSIYRWLNPEKIKEDYIRINYIFTDWKRGDARRDPKYPQHPIMHKDIQLLSPAETEKWVRGRIAEIIKYQDAPENQVPECTDEELWRSDTVYKYFSDPEKAKQPGARSTKNFEHLHEARMFQSEKGGKGVIVPVEGVPKRCDYCGVYDVCKQKDRYFST
ncbi:exonuclease [Achromobacter phage vB_AxyP_19-32_Axy24]|uniref:PD-(D/E)XK endonuclease-like domain-containing protein n=4 Tax=Dongdastvirus TaxID=2842653 RepID=A0A514CUE0_9CAUD|nr:exonuclease [Achromobacter phage phiAxp-3]YP_010079016.1 exonuclease [Achromobacter phage vB_AxyP_19-32_Axy04]YP_010079099.1 exonuclease [Achromobacter phage vB_AxyP_19-32_Axy12]YP_010079180.1 exonuclease [Achromobacter phage vB_AxyP_19-32_Axy24]ALA45516.1 hypothetical protein ADP65_00047 [Achromobacter phage phiAxp-3]QDH83747.1 hypothetical protein Axy04_048 [Achromobacter phage vB_AxyP_19-32_Axy04]QDH84095.1 hypothetical protein Axy12_051 [Achromobacter phage vB_AxyP_19-32_Axy12]QDH8473